MKRVGRYELGGEIGRGASGIVYRATDPAIGRAVAVKIIRLDDFADPAERAQLRARLFREARAAGALLHPNIVTIFDAGEESDGDEVRAYIAMELVDGAPLNQRWKDDQVIPNDALLAILRQTASALDFAHQKGIIHRDVKPANILVTSAGRGTGDLQAKILDFGIAKLASQQMTHSGTLVGTPNYMSPEQIEGTLADGRSDQFSLAVVAYEMLTGEKPFRGATLPSLLYQITQQSPQPAHLINPSLPAATSAALQRALSKHPIGRFRSCGAFIEELERTLATKPDWHALPAGSAADLPTIATSRPAPPTLAIPKPTTPAVPSPTVSIPIPLPDSHTPARLDERRRPGVHWAALIGILLLIIAGMFAYWAFEESGPHNTEPPGSISDSGDESRPSPLPSNQTPPTSTTTPSTESNADGTTPNQPQQPNPASAPPSSTTSEITAPDAGIPNFDSSEPTLVQIVTRPAGARVSVDNGVRTCTSPCSILLERGPHTIVYSLDTYRTLTRRIEVPKQTETQVDLERATGTLMLRSNPASAVIAIDGNAMMQKTPAVITLPIGKHRLRLTLEGKQPYEEVFEIKDQVTSTLSIDW